MAYDPAEARRIVHNDRSTRAGVLAFRFRGFGLALELRDGSVEGELLIIGGVKARCTRAGRTASLTAVLRVSKRMMTVGRDYLDGLENQMLRSMGLAAAFEMLKPSDFEAMETAPDWPFPIINHVRDLCPNPIQAPPTKQEGAPPQPPPLPVPSSENTPSPSGESSAT